jgi:hypothetical protein
MVVLRSFRAGGPASIHVFPLDGLSPLEDPPIADPLIEDPPIEGPPIDVAV